MKVSTIPGFTADITLYKASQHYYTGKTFINSAFTTELLPVQLALMISPGGLGSTSTMNELLPSLTETTIARYGCSECVLYTEPGPGGRTAGVRRCCQLTCRTTIFGTYRCYEYCSYEVCATFPPDKIIV